MINTLVKDVYTCHFCDLTEYGIAKPPTVITIEDKIAIVQSITLYHALLKSKAVKLTSLYMVYLALVRRVL